MTHVVNAPRIFDLVFSIFKPFLSEYTRESIKFHSSLDTLHEDVGKEILPEVLNKQIYKVAGQEQTLAIGVSETALLEE